MSLVATCQNRHIKCSSHPFVHWVGRSGSRRGQRLAAAASAKVPTHPEACQEKESLGWSITDHE